MSLTREIVLDRLRTVQDPELFRDIVSLNMVKHVELTGGVIDLIVELTTPACPLKETIERDVRAALAALPGFKDLKLTFTADVARATPQQNAAANNPLPRVKHIVAIGAGKGGVGKSTVAVNVAVGLGRYGARAALLDGDIYGPSAPTLLGLGQEPPRTTGGNMLLPYERHGIGSMTIGQLVEPEKPLIWRGPMAHGAFRQLATQTDWGDRDYLIIDLPPGTGDVPLTMSQLLPLTGAVVVCTPQKVAQDDAVRALNMFRQLKIPVLGVVENMSWFIGDDGKEYDIFGRGGAEKMASRMGVPFLGAIPISMPLRAHSDAGTPLKNFDDPALREHLDRVVRNLAGQVSVQALTAKAPTLSVS